MTSVPPRLSPDAAGIARAADLLRLGRLVAFPTETVYGLGARADDDRAVARDLRGQGAAQLQPADRASGHGRRGARALCRLDANAERLAAAFWPGPLTLVLPLRDGAPISKLATAGLPSLAVRVPEHPVARSLLAAAGRPGRRAVGEPVGPGQPDHGGPCRRGARAGGSTRSSTAAPARWASNRRSSPASAARPRLLRAGGLPAEALEAALGRPLGAAGSRPRRAGGAGAARLALRAARHGPAGRRRRAGRARCCSASARRRARR